MQVVLISGLSGSGKSIALNVLEDSGYYCVDNLPAPLLSHLVGHLRAEEHELVAVAVDMRGGSSIAALPPQLRKLEAEGVTLRFVFLDARDDVLSTSSSLPPSSKKHKTKAISGSLLVSLKVESVLVLLTKLI